MASRKGPDGRTIQPADGDDTAATRKVQRKSIRDRIASVDEDADQVVTHIAGSGPDAGVDDDATALTGSGALGAGDSETANTASTAPPPEKEQTRSGPTVSGAAAPGTGQVLTPRTVSGASGPTGLGAGLAAGAASDDAPDDENVTQVYRPSRPEPDMEDGDEEEATPDGTISDPVVGWLVVVDGPGRGAALPIGYGNNRIGRAPTEQICLDWGDDQVSRENHAIITYDGKHRKFYVQQGGGRNLTHVDDELVMVPIEVKGGEAIQMGQTRCRFVPFCGAEFDWQDQ